jgi:pyridoxal phosphate enzyme (YggS family)
VNPAALQARLADVRNRIARAAGRAGRDPASIRLVAVSKTFPADSVRAAFACGQVDFGENKVQEALQKIDETAPLPLRWHLVGHLQSNKAKKAAAAFHVVHSVDSVDLVNRLDVSVSADQGLDVLIQVDLAQEPTKHGVPAANLRPVVDAALEARRLHLIGLMLLPPAEDDPERARVYFRRLRELRDRLVAGGVPPSAVSELSMGMSHDFEVAVEEGSTIVRVGTAIFGSRTYQ